MLRRYSIIILLILFTSIKAQEKGQWLFGGGLGLSFGAVTQIGIAPQVGYQVNDWYQVGINASYDYIKINDHPYFANDEYHYLTLGQYHRIFLYNKMFFLHAEYMQSWYNTYDYKDYGNPFAEKQWLTAPALLIGGGYNGRISDNAGFQITLLYDLIQDDYSLLPKNPPVIYRFGVWFGF